jgi:hypothetical protein
MMIWGLCVSRLLSILWTCNKVVHLANIANIQPTRAAYGELSMGLLSIDNLAEGMVLGSDIHDRSGRLLLGSGTELNARHIRMFRTWGITEADIVGIDDQYCGTSPAADIDPACLKSADIELRPLFRNTDLSYPPMGEIYRLCLLRKVQNESR